VKIASYTLRCLLFVLIGTLFMVNTAQAGSSCHKINAKGTGQETSPGVTVATITGGGLLNGTTAAAFVPTDSGFAGIITFTTKHATLTLTVEGDFAGAAFTASGDVIASTGKLEGAVGTLTFNGIVNPADGSFVETVNGEICVDLAP
jgi:hypothetical protein